MTQQDGTARNEALFREANEILSAAAGEADDSDRLRPFICECSQADCLAEIRLTRAEYLEVREDRATFALVPGHEAADVEDVVERRERYWVVRKRT